jgi:hypothetical protein
MGTLLGKHRQGILELLQLKCQSGTTRLGYQMTEQEQKVRLLQRQPRIKRSLSHFVSGGWIDPNQSDTIGTRRLSAKQKGKHIVTVEKEDE